MITYKIVKFCNLTPLHLGTGRDDYSSVAPDLHSDTLSAALAAMLVQVSDNADVKSFMESFTISSAFPFVGNRLFLPKPIGRLAVQGCKEESVRKRLKKLKYLELPVWAQVVSGETPAICEKQLAGEFLLADGENDIKPYSSQVNQRVSVNIEEGNTVPFYFKWKYYSPDAGLFCIVDANDEMMTKLIELFKLLGETGIGSSKSVGGGKFDIQIENIELPTVADADSTLLLSLYIPTREELDTLDLEHSRYDLLRRGGYMAGSNITEFQHLLKESVYMMSTGSLLNGVNALRGRIADVTPKWNNAHMHRVLRSGCPIVIPVKKQDV